MNIQLLGVFEGAPRAGREAKRVLEISSAGMWGLVDTPVKYYIFDFPPSTPNIQAYLSVM